MSATDGVVTHRDAAKQLGIDTVPLRKLIRAGLLEVTPRGSITADSFAALKGRPDADPLPAGLRALVVQVKPATPPSEKDFIMDGQWRKFSGWAPLGPDITPQAQADGIRGWWRGNDEPDVLIAVVVGFVVHVAGVGPVDGRLPGGFVRWQLTDPPPEVVATHAGRRLRAIQGPLQYPLPRP